ncbi:ATP-binding protein [Bermanella sp. R86510]|uniref:ATP-binding protein n=1 Tax=unclassified Bermanella TaxID=2627862 RepID=UPI0037CA2806
MANKKGLSLYARIMLLGLAPALVLSIMLGGYFINARIQDVNLELENKGKLIAVQLAATADYFVLTGNQSIINPLTRVLLDDKDVDLIEIEDISGGLLFSQSDQGFDQQSDARSHLNWYQADIVQYDVLQDDDDWFNGSMVNQTDRARILGQVRVGLSQKYVSQRQQEILLHAMLIVIVALTICGLIAWLSGIRLVRPIKRLSDVVDQLSQSQYHTRTEVSASGEVGQLQKGVNKLAIELQKAEQVQQHYVRNLIRARETSESANKAKSEFLAVMTHELRTPMNGVLGMLQLLQGTPLNKEQADYVDVAISSGDHLLGLINDILDFSKIEQGRIELDEQVFDLVTSLKKLSDSFTPIAHKKGLSFQLELNGLNALWVKSDETRLNQVLLNLLANAVKFTDVGTISLAVENYQPKGDRAGLDIIVTDTGKGIQKEHMERIFEAFQQEDASISRQYGGTGLGLAISKQLVDKMNGELIVASEKYKGSRFICRFEWPVNTYVEATTSATAAPANESFKGRVLLVEDNEVNQKVAMKMLQSLGVEADLAVDGIEAVTKCQQALYDLVLMDLQMPNMDGYEATKVIRSQPGKNRHVPIIALTANAFYDVKNQCMQAGMSDFLAKPYKKATLSQVMSRWLHQGSGHISLLK